MWVHACHGTCMEVRNNLLEYFSSSNMWSLGFKLSLPCWAASSFTCCVILPVPLFFLKCLFFSIHDFFFFLLSVLKSIVTSILSMAWFIPTCFEETVTTKKWRMTGLRKEGGKDQLPFRDEPLDWMTRNKRRKQAEGKSPGWTWPAHWSTLWEKRRGGRAREEMLRGGSGQEAKRPV